MVAVPLQTEIMEFMRIVIELMKLFKQLFLMPKTLSIIK